MALIKETLYQCECGNMVCVQGITSGHRRVRGCLQTLLNDEDKWIIYEEDKATCRYVRNEVLEKLQDKNKELEDKIKELEKTIDVLHTLVM